jgi:hypothetical protein
MNNSLFSNILDEVLNGAGCPTVSNECDEKINFNNLKNDSFLLFDNISNNTIESVISVGKNNIPTDDEFNNKRLLKCNPVENTDCSYNC